MKLKSIMYALGYDKSREQLVRSEGARRVKQAETQMNLRQVQKTLTYCDRYGISSNICTPHVAKERSVSAPKTFSTPYGNNTLTVEQAAAVRGMTVGKWLQEANNKCVGFQCLEVDFAETERKIAAWVKGRKAGKGIL